MSTTLSALLAERAQLAATLGVSVSEDVFLIDDVVAEVARLRQRVARMCETLLSNTVIEDYVIDIVEQE